MTVVLRKSARARSRCCAVSMNSSHFCRPDWFDAYSVSSYPFFPRCRNVMGQPSPFFASLPVLRSAGRMLDEERFTAPDWGITSSISLMESSSSGMGCSMLASNSDKIQWSVLLPSDTP